VSDEVEARFAQMRRAMVEQIAVHAHALGGRTGRASLDARVMETLDEVPRHHFVPVEIRALAYVDSPLPIGFDKTISQPFMVALMTDLLDIAPGDRVLEVGTGLGYHAAVLARLARRVYSIEIVEELARAAAGKLGELGYRNVELRVGDGCHGFADEAPFDRISVAAAPDLIPSALLDQLAAGGRMVIPAGLEDAQQLVVVERGADGRLSTRELLPVRFAPLVVPH